MANFFNNPDVLMSTWYALMPSAQLSKGKVRKFVLFDRSLALFRGADGGVRCLDSRCPHMGADLSRGCVRENMIQCEFHHWRFDGDGRCKEIPYMSEIPGSAKVFSYPTEERYGFIWIFNGPQPTIPIPFFESRDHSQLVPLALPSMTFKCHSHIATCNGLDIQHMKALHNMTIVDEPEPRELDDYRIELKYRLVSVGASPIDWLIRRLLGKEFVLSFRTWGCNMATGEVNNPSWPILMMFNHIPLTDGGTQCQPFLFLRKEKGLFPWSNFFKLPFLLLMANHFLVDDIGLFNSIRFWPRLVEKDRPIKLFIDQVNRMETFKPN